MRASLRLSGLGCLKCKAKLMQDIRVTTSIQYISNIALEFTPGCVGGEWKLQYEKHEWNPVSAAFWNPWWQPQVLCCSRLLTFQSHYMAIAATTARIYDRLFQLVSREKSKHSFRKVAGEVITNVFWLQLGFVCVCFPTVSLPTSKINAFSEEFKLFIESDDSLSLQMNHFPISWELLAWIGHLCKCPRIGLMLLDFPSIFRTRN